MTAGYIVETANNLYFVSNNGKELVVKRVGSKTFSVCIRSEPFFIGDSISVEDDCFVLKEKDKVVLRTTKIIRCFKEIDAIELK